MIESWKNRLTIALLAVFTAGAVSAAPLQSFASPEDAVRAVQAALKSKDSKALYGIFGPNYNRVESQDAATRAATRDRLSRLFKEGWSISTAQDQSRIIRLGYEGWSFPVPLVKSGSIWHFDIAKGIEEIANRQVGRNELMAIDTFSAFNRAQELYKTAQGKYATRLVSTEGSQDGLYWTSKGADKSPLQQVVGDVSALTSSHLKGTPWFGYYYTLTSTKDGYVFAAWPSNYDTTGVMSFWSDQSGRVYEKDLGANGGSFFRSFDATQNPQGWELVP